MPLGNPQEKLAFVHIAGTNGKGSVLAMLSGVLARAGYRTGSFSSPELLEHRDMFRMNGRVIAKTEFARCMERVSRAAEELSGEGFPHPTAFEVDTALAFLWFQEKKCDIAIAEAGMGGLLDSTNVIPAPLVCVLTSISMDHMAALGDTLEAIAAQKAGIIKAEKQGGQPQTEAGSHAGDRRSLPGAGMQPADRGSGKALRREKELEGAAFFLRGVEGA